MLELFARKEFGNISKGCERGGGLFHVKVEILRVIIGRTERGCQPLPEILAVHVIRITSRDWNLHRKLIDRSQFPWPAFRGRNFAC